MKNLAEAHSGRELGTWLSSMMLSGPRTAGRALVGIAEQEALYSGRGCRSLPRLQTVCPDLQGSWQGNDSQTRPQPTLWCSWIVCVLRGCWTPGTCPALPSHRPKAHGCPQASTPSKPCPCFQTLPKATSCHKAFTEPLQSGYRFCLLCLLGHTYFPLYDGYVNFRPEVVQSAAMSTAVLSW